MQKLIGSQEVKFEGARHSSNPLADLSLKGQAHQQSEQQFMKAIGLGDLDMKVLDEEEFENFSSSSADQRNPEVHLPKDYPLSDKDTSRKEPTVKSSKDHLSMHNQFSIRTPHFGNIPTFDSKSENKESHSVAHGPTTKYLDLWRLKNQPQVRIGSGSNQAKPLHSSRS